MTQLRKAKQTAKRAAPEEQDTQETEPNSVSAETDELLDEIDSVLEENAEEFVSQYIQKGGE